MVGLFTIVKTRVPSLTSKRRQASTAYPTISPHILMSSPSSTALALTHVASSTPLSQVKLTVLTSRLTLPVKRESSSFTRPLFCFSFFAPFDRELVAIELSPDYRDYVSKSDFLRLHATHPETRRNIIKEQKWRVIRNETVFPATILFRNVPLVQW